MKLLDKTNKFSALVIGPIGLATVFDIYLARMITFESRPLDKTPGSMGGSGFYYKVKEIDAFKQTNRKKHFLVLFLNNFRNNQSLNVNYQFNNFIRLY